MNRTYFEPKQPNVKSHEDEANLLKLDTDTDGTDDDIELGQKINREINSSPHHIHQSLIDRTEQPLDLDATNRCYEWIKATAFRIKQSVQFFLLYLALIVLNAFVLIWVKSLYALCTLFTFYISILPQYPLYILLSWCNPTYFHLIPK